MLGESRSLEGSDVRYTGEISGSNAYHADKHWIVIWRNNSRPPCELSRKLSSRWMCVFFAQEEQDQLNRSYIILYMRSYEEVAGVQVLRFFKRLVKDQGELFVDCFSTTEVDYAKRHTWKQYEPVTNMCYYETNFDGLGHLPDIGTLSKILERLERLRTAYNHIYLDL